MSAVQSKLVKHYKEVRARLEAQKYAPPVSTSVTTETVQKRKSDFANRSDEIKEWVQRELAKWEPIPLSKNALTMDALIQEVADKYQIPVPLMLQDSRQRPLVLARQEMFYRCVMEKGWSYARIGRYFDRDHTTVLHGVRAHARKHNLPLPEGVKS